jgi:hypothetical protein
VELLFLRGRSPAYNHLLEKIQVQLMTVLPVFSGLNCLLLIKRFSGICTTGFIGCNYIYWYQVQFFTVLQVSQNCNNFFHLNSKLNKNCFLKYHQVHQISELIFQLDLQLELFDYILRSLILKLNLENFNLQWPKVECTQPKEIRKNHQQKH